MENAPSVRALQQYAATTGNLTARIALHRYGTNPQGWYSWLHERLPLDGDVLEVGAGTGKLWSHAGPREIRLTLTDFSPAMCEQLRSVPGAVVHRCDATSLPFAAGSYDGVIANHMLYHLDDPDAGLREFARVLRPGGRVAVAVNGRGHLAELTSIGAAVGRPDLRLSASCNDITAETAPDLMGRHFVEIAVERYHGDLEVPAVEPILEYLASLSEDPLTPGQQRAVRELVQSRIDTDGMYRIRKDTVLITARTDLSPAVAAQA
ncbi:class I SAM-dependent methyltransferase [Actinoplanes sp. NBRC 101535]|uniref:class I SAM-dependent methyltransferase n=1 Tax=Actinoplanes sp. NBRC 101535 TaxID=3032196 RepID=UPI0024A1BEDF|nr:class I SAM-dependent methyltransferase [Actinoplanes sp. NBRC 101535]GLY07129.1 hypothetical protein Acsp01_75080 [Actinoplanes sp. NBRC 101535]